MSTPPISLDPELLLRLDEGDPPERWREILGAVGFLDLRPDDSPEGARIATIQALLRPMPVRRQGWSWVESRGARRLGMVVLLVAVAGVALWMMSRGSGFFCFSFIFIAPFAAWGRDPPEKVAPPPTAEEQDWPRRAAEIQEAFSWLIGREFVLPMGDRLVESLPTLRTLRRLEAEAEGLETRAKVRIEQLLATAAGIETLDAKLGQAPGQSVRETGILRAEADAARAELLRAHEAHAQIVAHRARVEAEVDRWRLMAERRRLSNTAGLLVGPEAETARRGELARLTSVTEVELLDLERRLRPP